MTRRAEVLTCALLMFWVSSFLFGSGSSAQTSNDTHKSIPQMTNKSTCLDAARVSLGPRAEVLKCGAIHDSDLEVAAITRVQGLRDDNDGIPIARLVILKRESGSWVTELNINEEITNPAGYVGIDYIDDSQEEPYYRLKTSADGAKWGTRQSSQFTLVLRYMSRAGKVDSEEEGIGIGWNPTASRFQEIAPSGDIFLSETKNPKHIRVP